MLLLYSKISEDAHDSIVKQYLNDFDQDFQKKILRYRRWQDSQLSLLGRLMLLKAFEEYGICGAEINNLEYNKFGKPFLKTKAVFFNISHSGDFVICAVSKKSEIGIDIEKMTAIDLADFKPQMTADEWSRVVESENKRTSFFEYWTQKEAVIKAHGHGLTLPLKSFEVLDNKTMIDGEDFYLKEIEINEEYKCYISQSIAIDEILIKEILIN
ncbi:4'-phosphopantetheinyl transferase [Flavobacterium araucananum]|uniref:4-phosphopantetheinyl transferase n=1 Tax=Flavobacterium araucananum TaxID=946678 RepID=A0A227PJ49_9FLAO|nr:4'-phosphopantetheinyl transferase superfamily protein [Flavobacterium araucananum]OXG09136.1 4-phosphopantetheinyl transferase [Flavobacterium araucananum]PWJ99668.1 4'-phosphopantetheinyl transferase [Flavobacterium araucananum]